MNRQRTNKTNLVLFFILCFLTAALISYFTDQTIYNNSLFNKISISIYLGRASKQSLDLISHLKDDLKSINDSFIDYERIHNDIVFNRSSNRRVLFYKSSQVGYGNNIYSMLSAFMIAVLTESALLVDWPEIDKYIEPPFNLSFSRFHDSSELDLSQKSPPIFVVHPETENSFRRDKRLLIDISLPSSYYSRLYLSHYTAYFFDLCLNPAHGVKLAKFGLVRKDTVIRALESLQDLNVIESQKIEYLMLIGFEFAGNALNKHWLLKPYLRDKISSYYENEFIGTFVIGIQLRLYYLTKSDLRTFFSCALEIERQRADIIGKRTVRWFVSTDKSDVLDEIEREFGDKIIMGYGKLGHVNKQPDAYERALFDVEMLARCNELILTGGSTFGLVASFMSQKRPFYVEGKRHGCGVLSLAMPPIQFDGHSSI